MAESLITKLFFLALAGGACLFCAAVSVGLAVESFKYSYGSGAFVVVGLMVLAALGFAGLTVWLIEIGREERKLSRHG